MSAIADRLSAALSDRYRLEGELGQGGMATVYLAQDLKHDRKVALKVLRPELAAVIGADRFLAEIKTTANLQHPHILPLHDSGEAGGFLFYVMPYVEGVALRDRIAREHQLPVGDAVRIATEVASALDYAHRHGVIHRDIKPENILLHDGSALVADFGIALAVSTAGTRMTETGMSLGTPHYMSPEQAMGEREITARSDVYALGCITYEMLTGEPPFTGATAQAIIARVLTEEPRPLSIQRRTVPPGVEAAVLTALEKLPADRYATAAEFAAALANPTATVVRTGARPAAATGRRGWLIGGVAVVAALIAGLLIGGRRGDPGSIGPGDVVRAELTLPDSVTIPAIASMRLAISPSGRRLAFVGKKGSVVQLWVRELGDPTAHPLADTQGALDPFFSPDGESVGFFAGIGSHTALKVVGFAGGAVRTVVSDSVAPYGGGSWGDDDRIYFTYAGRGIAWVASSGGAATVIARPDSTTGGTEFDFPDVLPGSRQVLVMLWRGSAAAGHIGVIDVAAGRYTDLTAGSIARYVAPGFLAIGTADGRVLVARFDVARGRLTGAPVPMLQGVQEETTDGTVQFAVSATGTLVYERQTGDNGGLVWVDRSGVETPVDTSMRGIFQSPSLSPDGTQIAVALQDAGETQVWVKQLATGAFSRLTSDMGNADRPVWAPDGRRVAFLATRNGTRTAFIRRADGSDSPQPAVPGNPHLDEIWFDPSGRYVVLRSEGSGSGTRHLLVVENGRDTVPRLLVQSRFDHYAAILSPDGHWLAYVSEESGIAEVYVRPFPGVDSARFAISVGGGVEPVWSRNGTELFFRSPRGEMFTTPVTTGRQFAHGTPRLLFTIPGLGQDAYHRSYDVRPDGKRFLMLTSGGADAPVLNAIFNWRAELARLKATPK